jgi:uncharacterized membrane-anchored protein
MKRTVVGFVISALILVALAVWALKGHLSGNIGEIAMAGIVLVLVGFALFVGVSRLRSHRRHEPAEDEMSRQYMTRASSLAFYISIYLWLFVMYVSDKTTLPSHTLIGGGIVAMAMVFFLCWLGVRLFGMKHE